MPAIEDLSRRQRRVLALAIATAVGLLAVSGYRIVAGIDLWQWWVPLACLGGMAAADLGSGLVHWAGVHRRGWHRRLFDDENDISSQGARSRPAVWHSEGSEEVLIQTHGGRREHVIVRSVESDAIVSQQGASPGARSPR